VNWKTIAKYGSGVAIYGSVFYLVLAGKIPASEYLGLATAGLAALGYHVASLPKPPAA